MPNHVTNILRVSGDPEKVKAMFEDIKDDKIGLGSIDFNKVIPMPEHIFRGNERYNLMVNAPEHKAKLFGKAGGR